jgi:hypothetical protein
VVVGVHVQSAGYMPGLVVGARPDIYDLDRLAIRQPVLESLGVDF